jgi:TetR/AcrR family transcriptional regulator of autoinduction and epiphytic fitness
MAGATTRSGADAGDGRRPSDRRRERGERTRLRIVHAVIDLIEGGNLRPTSRQVARQAGVSPRLIFHHFRRIEVVIGLAAELQAARHSSFVTLVPPHGPLSARVGTICRQRRKLFETTGVVLRVAHARELNTPGLHEVLGRQRSVLRRQLEVTLGPEIESQGDGSGHLLELLEYATGWQQWSALRFEGGLSASAAERAMASAVTDLLSRNRHSGRNDR